MNGLIWWRFQGRASNLARKLIALNFSQKVLNFRKIYTPKTWVVTVIYLENRIGISKADQKTKSSRKHLIARNRFNLIIQL
jgi:hypothetical protein